MSGCGQPAEHYTGGDDASSDLYLPTKTQECQYFLWPPAGPPAEPIRPPALDLGPVLCCESSQHICRMCSVADIVHADIYCRTHIRTYLRHMKMRWAGRQGISPERASGFKSTISCFSRRAWSTGCHDNIPKC